MAHDAQLPADDAQRPVDHYAVLGLRSDATADQVRAAFRRAARTHHPDSQFGEMPDDGHDAMARVNAAYAVLSDPHRRAQHDLSLRRLNREASGASRVGLASRVRPRGWALAGLALLTLGSAAASWQMLRPGRETLAAVPPAPAMRPAAELAPGAAPVSVAAPALAAAPAPAPAPAPSASDAGESPLRLTSSRELRRHKRKVPKRERHPMTVAGLSR